MLQSIRDLLNRIQDAINPTASQDGFIMIEEVNGDFVELLDTSELEIVDAAPTAEDLNTDRAAYMVASAIQSAIEKATEELHNAELEEYEFVDKDGFNVSFTTGK